MIRTETQTKAAIVAWAVWLVGMFIVLNWPKA
jgi:hypothetical protein